MKPIRTHQIETKLEDNIEVTVIGEVYEKPIFEHGDQVHNLVKIVNKKAGTVMGINYYINPMPQAELEDKVQEIADNVEWHLFHHFRKTIN